MLRILLVLFTLSLATSAQARWTYGAERDPFTDERASTAIKSNPGLFGASLVIRCKEGLLESYYVPGQYIGSSRSTFVRYRFDRKEPETDYWSLGTQGTAAFSSTAVEFAREIVSGSTLVIEADDFSDTPHRAKFSLSGSSGPVGRVLSDCKLRAKDPRLADSGIWRRVVQDVDELDVESIKKLSGLLDDIFEDSSPHGDRTGLRIYRTLTNIYLNTIDDCLAGKSLVAGMPSCKRFLQARKANEDADYPIEAVELVLELLESAGEREAGQD